MIKDKITRQLKNRFQQEIEKTVESGKERGFFICIERNKKEKLVPSKNTCEGDGCQVFVENIKAGCPDEIQGDFHTHPYLSESKRTLKEEKMSIPSDGQLKNMIKDSITKLNKESGVTGISPNAPSYTNLLNAFLSGSLERAKFDHTKGTTCVGDDLDRDKVECWTLKPETVNEDTLLKVAEEYLRIEEEGEGKGEYLRPWIIPLFDKEVISLENDERNKY